uniref:Alpha 1,4-glycosyltransferase domain-containing protein n=1 Tax=Leptobrachium leishanense TaxID=445787 RepID=A0A8C5MDK8_9ANUR
MSFYNRLIYNMANMLPCLKLLTFLVLCAALGYLYKARKYTHRTCLLPKTEIRNVADSYDILGGGKGIILLEVSDRMNPPPLVLCSIESIARVYPERPVVFFMKGLPDIESGDYQTQARKRFPVLSSFENIYFFPLRMDELYADTPFLPWYKKVDPAKERYWIHVSADGCRLAAMWKYGGIYMDTDVIAMRPIPYKNFLAAETGDCCSNSVFGLDPRHNFTWQCMEDFVESYRGDLWAHQGPQLFTRIMKKTCGMPTFKEEEDASCGNIPYFHPQRLYPILYSSWKSYYEVWKEIPTFNDSYSLHLWNFMNRQEKKTLILGRNTLVEHLFKMYCPTTYASLSNSNLHLE